MKGADLSIEPCNTLNLTALTVSSRRDNRRNPEDKFAPVGWTAVSPGSGGERVPSIVMVTEFPLQKKSSMLECVLQLDARYLKQTFT